MQDCYYSESKTVSCDGGEVETVKLYLEECDDCDCDDDDYEIKVYDVDTDPSSVDEGDDIEIEGRVKLIEAPSGDHDVTVKWYIDGDLIKKKTYSLEEGESKKVSYEYDTDGLDKGYHTAKIKAYIEGESDSDSEEFYVDDDGYDYDDYEIDVGSISLDDSHPDLGDTLSGSVPIRLKESKDLPEDVGVKLYIDNYLEFTDTIEYNHLATKTYHFSVDLDGYSEGEHIVKIKAMIAGASDSSERHFTIEDGIYLDGKEHCLSYYRIWNKENLAPGEDANIYVKVLNCGYKTEPSVKVRLNAFGHNYDKYIGSLAVHASKEIVFTIQVPEDVSGQTTFYGKVWNSYTQDTKQKDFIVYNSIPFIEIKEEYKVKTGKTNKITFTIRNNGHVEDIFDLSIIGDASSWISGLPESISIKPHQKQDITIFATIPCDTEPGVYAFKVIVTNGDEIVGSSQLRVVKGFTWSWKWPTGWTIRGRIVSCCKIVFIIFLIVLVMLWLYWKAYRIRKIPI